MAGDDARYAHLEARAGLVPASLLSIEGVRRAFGASLPTRWHAARLAEAAVHALGARAFLDPSVPEGDVAIYLRASDDARFLVARALLTLSRGPGSSRTILTLVNPDGVVPEDAPEGWKPGDPPYRAAPPKAQLRPRGPEMCGGRLVLAEGRSDAGFDYDDEGMAAGGTETGGDTYTWCRRPATSPILLDTLARPPSVPPLSLVLSSELTERGLSADALAGLLARSEAEARCALRVHLPVPTPGGVVTVRDVALRALRAALLGGEIPLSARWAVADGLEGKALGWGASADEALEELRADFFRKKPRAPGAIEPEAPSDAPAPPPPSGPTDETLPDGRRVVSTGVMQFSFAGSPPRFPWPKATPASCPALLAPLPEPPEVPPALRAAGFTRVARTLGDAGAPGHLFVREDARGITAIGEHVGDLVDVERLDAELAAAIAEHDADLEELRTPGDDFREQNLTFRLFDDERRVRTPLKVARAEMGARLGRYAPLGDEAPWRILVTRRVE